MESQIHFKIYQPIVFYVRCNDVIQTQLKLSAQELLNLKKKKKTIPKKIDPGINKKCCVKYNKTITSLHFVQYDILWSTGLGQYCFSVLHNTSYRTQ